MGPKQLYFPVTIYLMQLFPAEWIIQKTGLFKFGERWSPIFAQNERTRGQQTGSYAFPHKGLKSGNTDCLQVKEAEFHSEITDMKSFFPFLRLFDSQ